MIAVLARVWPLCLLICDLDLEQITQFDVFDEHVAEEGRG